MINIKQLKLNFADKYPQHTLTQIILSEPDEIRETDFMAKVSIWLKIFNFNNK